MRNHVIFVNVIVNALRVELSESFDESNVLGSDIPHGRERGIAVIEQLLGLVLGHAGDLQEIVQTSLDLHRCHAYD